MSEIDDWEKSLISESVQAVEVDKWSFSCYEGSLSYNKKLRRLEKSLRLYI